MSEKISQALGYFLFAGLFSIFVVVNWLPDTFQVSLTDALLAGMLILQFLTLLRLNDIEQKQSHSAN